MRESKATNLLDSDNPKIDTPLLLPKKYFSKIKSLVKISKEKLNDIFNRTRERTLNLFDKYNPLNNKATDKITNWFNHLKDNVLDIFSKIQGKVTAPAPTPPEFKLDKEALKVTKRYEIDLKEVGLSLYDPLSLLKKIKPLVIKKFKKYPSTKQQITLVCLMKKTNPATGEETTDNAHFHSYYEEIFDGSNFDEIYEKITQKVILSCEEFLRNSSLWKFYKGLKLILNINEIKRLLASSYIPLPDFLKNKNAIINPQNGDQKCLLWCVTINELLKTTPNLKDSGRITKILKKKSESFNVKDINFPCD